MSVRTFIGVIALVAIVAAAAAVPVLVPPVEDRQPTQTVTVIPLNGQIAEGVAGLGGTLISPATVRQRLEAASADPRVGAVVLRVNSPGGSVAASQEIVELIEDHPDPVVVSMGDQAASGGYYISLGAERIVAQPGTITGSIGVISQAIDVSELLEDLGIEIETLAEGELKDALGFEGLDDDGRAMLEAINADAYEQFVAAVAEGRDLSEAEARDLADGSIVSGEEALERDLVDDLGGVDEAVEQAAELAGIDDPVVVEDRPGLFDGLLPTGLEGTIGRLLGEEPADPVTPADPGTPGDGAAPEDLDVDGLDLEERLVLELLRDAGTPQYLRPAEGSGS